MLHSSTLLFRILKCSLVCHSLGTLQDSMQVPSTQDISLRGETLQNDKTIQTTSEEPLLRVYWTGQTHHQSCCGVVLWSYRHGMCCAFIAFYHQANHWENVKILHLNSGVPFLCLSLDKNL